MKRRLKQTALALAFALVVFHVGLRFVPLPENLMRDAPGSVEFTDREGRPLRLRLVDQRFYSKGVPLDEIPKSLVDATIAAEDKRFWSHGGVDWLATSRAAASQLGFFGGRSGGSTITQQLIKLAQPRPRTLRTKLIESLQAMRLEQVWDKRRILREYLNRVDYGNLRIGCASASDFYFGKPPTDLSVAESALLAGLPQSPSRLNPQAHPKRAQTRKLVVLQRMLAGSLLTTAETQRAASEPLKLRPAAGLFRAPHAVDWIMTSRDEAAHPWKGGDLRTTIDLPLQENVEAILRGRISRLQANHVRNGAAVVLDNHTGEVLAMVGSEDFFAPGSGQVNGAWAPRSPGSALKPFTYELAFEHGATPATVVADVPSEFLTPAGVFRPVNFNHHFGGPMRHRLALANSLNVSAVKVLDALGGATVLKQRLVDCGLTTLTEPADHYGLGLTIGSAEVRLLELANAYASLARLGVWKPFRLTFDDDASPGRIPARVMDKTSCWLIADILSDNDARVPAFGPDSALRFDFPVACKTGTSSDFRDNWAMGYTPEFTVGVWIGNFDGTPMDQVCGVIGAAPILHDIFESLHRLKGTTWYEGDPQIRELPIHRVTGKQVARGSPSSVMERFATGHPPSAASESDTDARGRIQLGPEYREWLASGDNWLGASAVAKSSTGSGAPQILSPLNGCVYYLDPDLPDHGGSLRLRSEPVDGVVWSSDTLRVERSQAGTFARLEEGRHRLRARHPSGGDAAETWIEVRRL